MKGSGVKVLLQIWLAVLFYNTASPAACAVMCCGSPSSADVAAMRVTHRMPGGGCPLEAKKRDGKLPSCLQIRAQSLGQYWHQQKHPLFATLAVAAILPGTWKLPLARPALKPSNFARFVENLHERDVGTNQPRAPPTGCV